MDKRRHQRGDGIPITEESVKGLIEDTKQRLRRRIEAERTTSRRLGAPLLLDRV